MPWLMGVASLAYGVIAAVLGAIMLMFAARVYYYRAGRKADPCAKQLFGFSILYLFLLFAVQVLSGLCDYLRSQGECCEDRPTRTSRADAGAGEAPPPAQCRHRPSRLLCSLCCSMPSRSPSLAPASSTGR